MNRILHPLILLALTSACDRTDPADTAVPVETTGAVAGDVAAVDPQGAVVIVSVLGVEPGGEPVDAVLQTEAEWGTEVARYRAQVPADADAVALRFDGVVPGRYGVVAVQPTLPAVTRPGAGEEAGDVKPTGPAPLASGSAGGWAALGADGRALPKWDATGVAIGADGATVPLTLTRR